MVLKKSYLIILLLTVPSYVVSIGYVRVFLKLGGLATTAFCSAAWWNVNNIKKRIVSDARNNMPKELIDCQSTQDMRNLLEKQRNDSYNNLQQVFNVPDDAWNKCKEDTQHEMAEVQAFYKSESGRVPKRDECFDRKDIQKVEKILKDNGINPNNVDILNLDNKEDPKNSNTVAGSWVGKTNQGIEAKLFFSPQKNSIKDIESEYHEPTHLVRMHNIQNNHLFEVLLFHSPNVSKNIEKILDNKSYLKFHVNKERQASVDLLLKPENRNDLRKVYNENLRAAVMSEDQCKNQWNATIDGTHPHFCNTLMWHIKAQDLANKQQETTL